MIEAPYAESIQDFTLFLGNLNCDLLTISKIITLSLYLAGYNFHIIHGIPIS
jgi:hypothetical protein